MDSEQANVAIVAPDAQIARDLQAVLRTELCACSVHSDPAQFLDDAPQPHMVLLPISRFASILGELRDLRQALAKAQIDLEDRKLIERAKGLVMRQRGLSESEAYRSLQKLAMDRKRRLADVARSVLESAELLTPEAG